MVCTHPPEQPLAQIERIHKEGLSLAEIRHRLGRDEKTMGGRGGPAMIGVVPRRLPRDNGWRGSARVDPMKFFSFLFSVVFAAIAPAAPVISEFMASNATTLRDGHGNYEDWVEIWNPGAAAVDLAGWRLTDDAGAVDTFVFPSRVLPAGGRLVVFCSGRVGEGGGAHVDPEGFLHAPFALAKGGEYLGLVAPDGVTRSTEFTPAYPPQVTDLSYGTQARTETLVNETTPLRYFVPTNATPDTAATNWRAVAYNDNSWRAGVGSGVGFELGSPVGVWLMDEAAGAAAAADASGSGHAAVPAGVAPVFGAPGAGASTGGAARFDGAGSLSVPFSSRLNPPTVFSFAAWVKPTGGSGYRAVVSSRTGTAGGQRGYILYLTPANTWEFWTGTGTTWHVVAGGPAAVDAWTHIAITRSSSGTKRLYVNGVQAASTSGAYAPVLNPAHGFHLGGGDDTGGSYHFVGLIDDAVFFPAELPALLVQQCREAGAASFPTPLYPAHYQNDVRGPMAAVSPGLFTRHRFHLGDKSLLASLRLRVKYDDAYVAFLNGVEVARGNFTGERVYSSTADTDRGDTQAIVYEDTDISAAALPVLVNGTNVLAVHGFRRSLNHEDFLLVPVLEAGLSPAARTEGFLATATPGAPNGGVFVDPGPSIDTVAHQPLHPLPGETVTVTARVTPRLGPVASVTLVTRVMYGPEAPPVPMTDAGPAPGAADGSRIFTAEIPNAGGAAARRMLRYFLTATDTAGRSWRAPYPVDLSNADGVSQSPQYFGLVVRDPALTGGMPIMQWFTNDVTNSDTRTGSRASVLYGGTFYDNIHVRQRGGYTSAGSQKFNFNRGDGLYVNETLGRVGEVNMNGTGADPNYYRVAGSYEMLRTSGHPACESFVVAMYRNGVFQRMGILIEQVDEDYLERWGHDPDGAMYKFVQRLGETPLPGGDYSNSPAFGDTLYGIEKKTRLREGMGDLEAFIAGLLNGSADERKAHLFGNLNLPNFINFMAMRPLLADSDTNRKNFYFYRDSNGSREWYLFPWDKDGTMMGTINPWQATLLYKAEASTTKQWNVLWEQGYQSPEIRAMVGRRLRTLMDTLMGPPGTPAGTSVLEQRLAVVRSTMTPLPPGVNVSGYNAIGSWNSWLSQNRTSLYTTFGPSSTYRMIPAAATAAAAAQVHIESADPNPASGSQQLEHLVLRNQGAEAVDLTGWSLRGGGIRHTFKAGTVIVGTGVSTTLNRAVVCNDRAAYRLRPGAPATAEYLLGNYDGALSARGGTVELRDASGSLISSYALPVAPSPAQQSLRLSKVMFAPPDPTAAERTALPGVEAKDFEYLELVNIGAAPLSLEGCRFTDGITYAFPAGTTLSAGARLALAAHPAAFALRYGAATAPLGPFSGVLDNAGERVRLVDAVGEEILDFAYAPEWSPASLGGGYALVVRDPSGTVPDAWGDPRSWAASGRPGGAPGEAEPFFSREFAGWTFDVFSDAERADPQVSGPLAAPHAAGIPNLMAFALGLDPQAPDPARLPELVMVEADGRSSAALRFRRWKSTPGLTYTLEASPSLEADAWQPTGTTVTEVDHGDGSSTVTVRDSRPADPGGRAFLRLKVSQ